MGLLDGIFKKKPKEEDVEHKAEAKPNMTELLPPNYVPCDGRKIMDRSSPLYGCRAPSWSKENRKFVSDGKRTCERCGRVVPRDKFYPGVRKCRNCYETVRRQKKRQAERKGQPPPSDRRKAELENEIFCARKTIMDNVNYHLVHGNFRTALVGANELCKSIRRMVRLKEGKNG